MTALLGIAPECRLLEKQKQSLVIRGKHGHSGFWSPPQDMSFHYGEYNFDGNQELVRRAGSDWLKDTKEKLRKVRAWKPAEGRWDLTEVGKA